MAWTTKLCVDVVLDDFEGQRLTQANHTKLRRAVCRQVGAANLAVDGRDVDDVPLFLLHHSREYSLAAEQDAFQVCVNRVVQVLQVQVKKTLVDKNPGIPARKPRQ